MLEKSKALLIKHAGEYGYQLGGHEIKKLQIYMELLLEWNEKFNLTSITDEDGIIVKHFLDSFSCGSIIDGDVNGKLIDIGTGAGFPGIPLAIARPNIKVTLLESLRKRVSFLNEIVEKLCLKNIEVINGRAEEYGRNIKYRETFNWAVARAVAKLNILVELSVPFLVVEGIFIAMKGPDNQEEIGAAAGALKELRSSVKDIKHIELPVFNEKRELLVIAKDSPTPEKYPRRPGIPEKRPL